jgi:uncharacterized protein (TIGR00251 family)
VSCRAFRIFSRSIGNRDPMADSTDGAVIIDVRVIPRSGTSGIAGTRDGAVLVRVNAPPVEGAANAEVIAVIADALDVPKRSVTILSGDRSRQKRIRIDGITAAHAASRLPH